MAKNIYGPAIAKNISCPSMITNKTPCTQISLKLPTRCPQVFLPSNNSSPLFIPNIGSVKSFPKNQLLKMDLMVNLAMSMGLSKEQLVSIFASMLRNPTIQHLIAEFEEML